MTDQLTVRRGLYDPANEHDACGVGMVVNIRGNKTQKKSNSIIQKSKNSG